MNFNLPKLIGHRGVKDLVPENTLQSINKAIELNLKWVEVDVKISKDRTPFLLHDDNLERTTSGNGNPTHYMYSELMKLDAGSWFHSKYKNIYLPTLEEVLTLCSQRSIGINIELKPNKGFEKENAIAVAELIKKNKFDCKYFFSSFDWLSIIKIKKLLPKSNVGILIDNLDNRNSIIDILNKCHLYNLFSCGFNIQIISDKIIRLCKKFDMAITVYSLQKIETSEAKKLWDLGVDSIFIDNPIPYNNILK